MDGLVMKSRKNEDSIWPEGSYSLTGKPQLNNVTDVFTFQLGHSSFPWLGLVATVIQLSLLTPTVQANSTRMFSLPLATMQDKPKLLTGLLQGNFPNPYLLQEYLYCSQENSFSIGKISHYLLLL